MTCLCRGTQKKGQSHGISSCTVKLTNFLCHKIKLHINAASSRSVVASLLISELSLEGAGCFVSNESNGCWSGIQRIDSGVAVRAPPALERNLQKSGALMAAAAAAAEPAAAVRTEGIGGALDPVAKLHRFPTSSKAFPLFSLLCLCKSSSSVAANRLTDLPELSRRSRHLLHEEKGAGRHATEYPPPLAALPSQRSYQNCGDYPPSEEGPSSLQCDGDRRTAAEGVSSAAPHLPPRGESSFLEHLSSSSSSLCSGGSLGSKASSALPQSVSSENCYYYYPSRSSSSKGGSLGSAAKLKTGKQHLMPVDVVVPRCIYFTEDPVTSRLQPCSHLPASPVKAESQEDRQQQERRDCMLSAKGASDSPLEPWDGFKRQQQQHRNVPLSPAAALAAFAAAAAGTSSDGSFDASESTSRLSFLVTSMGAAVGIGCVWRFPAYCYKWGGGTFLVPYMLLLLFLGVPLLAVEMLLFCLSGVGVSVRHCLLVSPPPLGCSG
ncbi:sodium:neurotransmitter symporter family protein [Cyclospora cayetanensis]|uniref:Sodium:neurotransmitter symporter family protein n=1 Tax=Cyclospora cayetanensis TaxID=88456 RepID=A0A1D3CRQ1_9EIME|nr:sodium:neurotransmitter symporter family protein [Cyclospora cayetanensis]